MDACARGIGRSGMSGASKKWLLVATAAVVLTGCGGGGSGVSLGDGQGSDPVFVDYPLVYIRKPVPVDDQGDFVDGDLREVLPVSFGADLYVRDRASVSADEENITGAITGGFGDIRDVSVSPDATRVLFSMRTPIDPNADDEDQPSWNLWELDLGSRGLRRIFTDDITAEEGHDIGGQYLPDGRIVFSSTRQNRSVAKLLDDSKPQFAGLDEDRNEPAFVLHVMEEDGSDLTQISFNQSHDLYPSVRANGRVMFTRWEGMFSNNQLSLYDMNPDGSDLQLLYGTDSHATGTNGATVQFVRARELLDGSVLSVLQPFSGTRLGGDLVLIDVANYLNDTQPTAINQGILTGPAQVPATVNVVNTEPGVSTGGRYQSAWPLLDGTGRLVVSWSLCQLELPDPNDPNLPPQVVPCTDENLLNPDAVEADPIYAIWLYDVPNDDTQPIVIAEPGFMFTEAVVARPLNNLPPFIADGDVSGAFDPALVSEDAGILDIRSVHDIDGVDTTPTGIVNFGDPALFAADERPERFLRIYKAVGIPDEETYDFDNSAFGVSAVFGMRELVGYTMVEPDGSVRVKVPADTPLTLDITDRNGRRISQRHNYWLQVRPGEVLSCNGCHDAGAGVSHGRADAFDTVYAGAAGNGVAFPNTDPLFVPTVNTGETMAQARTTADPAALEPVIDVVYTDPWTYPPDAGRPADDAYTIDYSNLVTITPDIFNCVPWTVRCRVLINYEDHIQPLWEVSRPVIDPDTMLEIGNNRCIDCHALRDPMNQLIDPVDRGQLELTSNASAAEALHYVSYRELLFGDFEEEIRDGAVQDVLEDSGDVDINGDPIFVPVPIASPLSAGGANARPAFFTRFGPAGAHPDWLSDSELKLISEWLDLGAQYWNNPFQAPEN